MPEFFETITKSYADVPIDANNGVDVNAFLEATENLIRLFDHINATAFSPVKSDMNGNVTVNFKPFILWVYRSIGL